MRPGFADLMQRSFDDEMRREGFSDVFIDQLVRGAMRTNYGQNEDITGFVGALISRVHDCIIFSQDWEHRREDDRLLIERILILVRNVLHIQTERESEQRTDDDASIHDQVLWFEATTVWLLSSMLHAMVSHTGRCR